MSARNQSRRGFTLTELICVLILLSAFAIVAGRLFQTTFHLYYDTTQAQNAAASIDNSLGRLRDDAWSASKVDVSDPHTAILTLPGNHIVTWTLTGNTFERKDDRASEHLQAPPAAIFASDSVALILKINDSNHSAGVDEIRMASQINVLAKLVP